jgi:hypothetical protein
MPKLKVFRSFTTAVSLEDLKFQIGEWSATVEDYINSLTNIQLINSRTTPKAVLQTLTKGDLVFDFAIPEVITLKQWNGNNLIEFDLGSFSGFVNLLTQGNGSGLDASLFLRSDGAGGWVLDIPTAEDTADINATENIPAFSLVTANGKIADSSNTTHFNHVVGLSKVAVLNGFVVTVTVEGEVTNPSWSWTNNDKIYLNGTSLSTTAPLTGFNQFIAIARNNNTIYVRLQQPVLL